jgi:cytochrome c-type biogenesis protein
MHEVSLLTAFTAGLVTFVSPCILPLIPAYLSFVSGRSIQELRAHGQAGRAIAWGVCADACFFVLGFSVVFVALGASATVIGKLLLARMAFLKKVSGALILVFGLHTLGVFRIRFFDMEKRYHQKKKTSGLLGSFLVGLAFSFGWTPCVGPILAAILVYAGTHETVYQGILLLSAYSLGLGIPFVLSALGMETFLGVSAFMKRHFRAIELVSGGLLIFVGLLIFSGDLAKIASLLLKALGGPPA